jgi:hypothetical protein
LVDLTKETLVFEALNQEFRKAQKVLIRIGQYTAPVQVQPCDHRSQILSLQEKVTDLKGKHFLPPTYDHTAME